MVFASWPKIHEQCPLCGEASCATYRGYYKRFMFCTELEVFGLVTIRTAFCRCARTRISFLPDFLIRYRRISKFSFQSFGEAFSKGSGIRMLEVIDDMTGDLGEEFYFPLSTAYNYKNLYLSQPP